MFLRITINIFLLFAVFVFHLAFVKSFGSWFSYFNLGLVALIFVLDFSGFFWSMCWALGLGFLFDIFYFHPFGIYIFCFLILVFTSYFLFIRFFTNRSLYSFLALTLIATLVFEIFYHLIVYIVNFYTWTGNFYLWSGEFWNIFFKSAVVNLVAVILLFNIFNFVSNRFNAVFLKK